MSISELDKRRLHFHCRRGMLEIDLILLAFFERAQARLSDEQWADFTDLLEEQDPDLYNWLMGFGEPESVKLKAMVDEIRRTIQPKNRS